MKSSDSSGYIGRNERLYAAYRLLPLARHLDAYGIPVSRLLAGTAIDSQALRDPSIHISRSQLIFAFENFIAAAPSHVSPLELGVTMQPTDYGLYGYALQSSPTVADAITFALSHHQLASPVVELELLQSGDEASWEMRPFPELLTNPRVWQFVCELQAGAMLALHRTVAGSHFQFLRARFSYSIPAESARYSLILGCPSTFHSARTELQFQRSWLQERPVYANALTFSVVEELCDQLVKKIDASRLLTAEVFRRLIHMPGSFPSSNEMGSLLELSQHALERQLFEEGSTYQQLVDEVRFLLASRYLAETTLALPSIAFRLGFSDVNQFEAAVRRWTGRDSKSLRDAASQRPGSSH